MRKILSDFIKTLPVKCNGYKRENNLSYLLLECPTCKKERWVVVHNIKSRIKTGVFTGECIHCTGAKHLKAGTRSKKGWKRSPEEAAKIGAKHKGKIVSEETRAKLSAKKKAFMQTPKGIEQRARKAAMMLGKKLPKETCEKMSQALREHWSNPEWHDMMLLALRVGGATVKPTKPELIVKEILDTLYPGEWKYTGDWQIVIAGLNPDFIHANGRHLAIECFGDYWHDEARNQPKGQEDTRTAIFKEAGYELLVIWEHELEDDMEAVIEKVVGFCEGELAFA